MLYKKVAIQYWLKTSRITPPPATLAKTLKVVKQQYLSELYRTLLRTIRDEISEDRADLYEKVKQEVLKRLNNSPVPRSPRGTKVEIDTTGWSVTQRLGLSNTEVLDILQMHKEFDFLGEKLGDGFLVKLRLHNGSIKGSWSLGGIPILEIYMPNEVPYMVSGIDQQFKEIQRFVRHELIHMSQDLINVVTKSNSGGLPSKDMQDGDSAASYLLDDREFYAWIDMIIEWANQRLNTPYLKDHKKPLIRIITGEEEIPRYPQEFVQNRLGISSEERKWRGTIAQLKGILRDGHPYIRFFQSLKDNNTLKWKKAVSELYKNSI